jgi:hypothetical protein
MEKLKNVLLQYKQLNLLGKSSLNKDQLSKDLIKLGKTNNIFFWICVIMVVIVFVIMIIFIIINNNNPDIIKAISGAAGGITIGGLIVYMNRLWKEKVTTDMLLILVTNMNEQDINSIVHILLDKLYTQQKIT